MTESQLQELETKLETDSRFEQAFEVDPVEALRAEGMDELAGEVENEIRGLVALAERIASDSAFAAAVTEAPRPTLVGAGLPEAAVEPFLSSLDAPMSVLERTRADVEGHGLRERAMSANVRLSTLLVTLGPIAAYAGCIRGR